MQLKAQGIALHPMQNSWRPTAKKAQRWTGFAIVLFGAVLTGSGILGWL